jgi:hypothetical protein
MPTAQHLRPCSPDKDLLAEAERLRIEIAPQSGESVQPCSKAPTRRPRR